MVRKVKNLTNALPKEDAKKAAITAATALKGLALEKAQLEQKRKQYERDLINYAENFPEDFEGKKSLSFGDAKVVIKTTPKLEFDKTFDLDEFIADYPELVETKLKTGEVKKACVLEDQREAIFGLGVRVVEESSYTVEVEK